MAEPKHVPALDGLRGLAILMVVVHHIMPAWLGGGFLGVDLFFVLSGFLITSLLVAEFETTAAISLKNFYLRRVLRLGPALFLYLIASLLVTYLLHPAELTREFKLVGLALAYSTNWRMALGWDNSLDPTAIIWSLSIEEQFYLLWPPLLLLCLSAKINRGQLVRGLAVVIVTVMLYRALLWFRGAEIGRLYYGTDTRADAPLVGCFIALLPISKISQRMKIGMQIVALVSICILAILARVIRFTDPILYLGGDTGVAILAAALTWTATNAPARWLSTALEFSLLRWFGKISYGLYLWHWLVIRNSTFYYWFGEREFIVKFLVAVAISALSFYLIERPFNNLKRKFSYARSSSTERKTLGVTQPDLNEEIYPAC